MTWIDRVEARMDEQAEESARERLVAAIEARIDDLEAWLTAVANDMLDRTREEAPCTSRPR
jgi:hypothetical protein